MEFDAFVRSLGLDPAALNAEQTARLEAAWRATQKPLPTPNPLPNPTAKATADFDALVQETEAENDRRARITALVADYLRKAPDRLANLEPIGRLALEGKWTVQQTELELMKSSYGNGPLAFSPSKPVADADVLEAAVCRAAGLGREAVEKSFGDRTLSQADKLFKGGCSLKRLITTAAQANGCRDPELAGVHGLKATLRYAFREFGDEGRAFGPTASSGFGPSTYDLSGILSNVANKFIRDAFNAVEMIWRRITAVRPVNDFKEISSYALTGDLTYKKVGPGGEVKHGTLGEETYGNKADLYALMLGIDYQHIRNDDLGAFAKLARRLGRGGNLTINDVFWTEWLAGAGTWWAAANQNYANHADYEFTLDKLGNASAAWDIRTDPDGKPMGDVAKFLLVPSALSIKAMQFMSSTLIGGTAGNGDQNVLAGKWEPLASTYLGNSSFAGYSTSNYFLVGDPEALPAIETVFLDGQEMPTVETAEPDLSRLGIMIRGTHAFGCRKQEKRGAYKFKQSA